MCLNYVSMQQPAPKLFLDVTTAMGGLMLAFLLEIHQKAWSLLICRAPVPIKSPSIAAEKHIPAAPTEIESHANAAGTGHLLSSPARDCTAGAPLAHTPARLHCSTGHLPKLPRPFRNALDRLCTLLESGRAINSAAVGFLSRSLAGVLSYPLLISSCGAVMPHLST